MERETMNETIKKKIKSGMVLLIILLMVASIVLAGCSTKKSSTTSKDNSHSTNMDMATDKTKNAMDQNHDTMMKLLPDGVYETQKTYRYHAGTETVDISITVKDGVVTEASLVGINPNPVSRRYQQAVNDALPDLVIGKHLSEINLPRQISGSSLTTAALDDYLTSLSS